MEKLISPEPGMILWTLFTFALLLFILGRFAWKPLLAALEERERTIRESLDAARQAQEQASTALEENRQILAEARKSAGEILDRARQEAEHVKSGILEGARRDQENLLERGREEIEREKRAAIQEIRGVAADLALSAAEKLIGARLDEAGDRRLVEGYLQELEGAGPRS